MESGEGEKVQPLEMRQLVLPACGGLQTDEG